LTIIETSLLLAGIFVFSFGIVGFFIRKWGWYIKYIFLVIGLILIYIPTYGPLSDIQTRIVAITEISSSQVQSIVLQPSRRKEYMQSSMYEKDSIITDRYLINEICEKLHKAKVLGKEYKNRPPKTGYRNQLLCRVEIHFINKEMLAFGLIKNDESTTLSLNSNGEFGWHYANLDAFEFGNLLTNQIER
jgi:hypothetical protein